jgi:hypothetical protein
MDDSENALCLIGMTQGKAYRKWRKNSVFSWVPVTIMSGNHRIEEYGAVAIVQQEFEGSGKEAEERGGDPEGQSKIDP